jgi:hypothetical protein
LATLLNNLRVQERQNRVCTTVAIAIVAETCSPFTVLPALMNEYRVPELNVQNGVLKVRSKEVERERERVDLFFGFFIIMFLVTVSSSRIVRFSLLVFRPHPIRRSLSSSSTSARWARTTSMQWCLSCRMR